MMGSTVVYNGMERAKRGRYPEPDACRLAVLFQAGYVHIDCAAGKRNFIRMLHKGSAPCSNTNLNCRISGLGTLLLSIRLKIPFDSQQAEGLSFVVS